MPYWRCNIQLAIPLKVYDNIPATKKLAARDAIRNLKALAVKINTGQSEEEMTVKANWHICHHDESPPQPCGPEQEI